MEKINDGILEDFFEERLENTLEQSLLQKANYKNALHEVNTLTMKLEELKLDNEQKLMVDQLLSANNLISSIYGKEAYKQGFQDSLTIILELCKLL